MSESARGGGAARWRVRGRAATSQEDLPPWTRALAEGDDAGFFGPGSAVWAVNGALPTLVAGIRALLLQTLHPGAMAGVHDWSRYNEDPLGRLDGTVRWVATTTFGDRSSATAASASVGRLHERIIGTYTDAAGVERPYAANDEYLLRWVHDAFTEAFLGAHEIWGGPIPGGPDGYVREWAQAGRLMGVTDPPTTEAGLHAEMSEYLREAKIDDRVVEAVQVPPAAGPAGSHRTGVPDPVRRGGRVARARVSHAARAAAAVVARHHPHEDRARGRGAHSRRRLPERAERPRPNRRARRSCRAGH